MVRTQPAERTGAIAKLALVAWALLPAACGGPAPAPPAATPAPPTAGGDDRAGPTPAQVCTRLIDLDRANRDMIARTVLDLLDARPRLDEDGLREGLARLRDRIRRLRDRLDQVPLAAHPDFEPMRDVARQIFDSYLAQYGDGCLPDLRTARDGKDKRVLLQSPYQHRFSVEQNALYARLRRIQQELAERHGFADRLARPGAP